MREYERIDRILELVRQMWLQDPDSRFLQLISNIESYYSIDNDGEGLVEYTELENGVPWSYRYIDLFNLEDDKLELYLQEKLAERYKKEL